MRGCNPRLEQVLAARRQRERTLERAMSGGDLVSVPQRAVLLVEQDERSVAHARVAPRVLEEQERVEAVCLRLVGHEQHEHGGEANRLVAQLASHRRAVAGVEDEVDDAEHRDQPVGKDVVARHAERDAGVADLALRAHEPLRHRRFGHEERARDLVRLESAERPQRERDLRLDPERRVAAREHEAQALVGDRRVVHRLGVDRDEQLGLARECPVATDPVDGAVLRHRHEPARRVGGHTVARPALDRGRDRVLESVLGEVEVAEDADQGCEDASVLLAEELLECRYALTSAWRITTGRTST